MPGLTLSPTPLAFPRFPAAIVPGAREWFLLALVTFVLFGRAAATGPGRVAARWLARPGQMPRRSSGGLRRAAGRWVEILMALVALAVIAWALLARSVARSRPGG